ncbi:MAG: DUF3267 domain-containing protein [Atopobiaceae bacterium]|nr:DUF3267 domain-containing protein [Atopobiaceae bacterium]
MPGSARELRREGRLPLHERERRRRAPRPRARGLLAPTVVVTAALAAGALAASCSALAILLCSFHLSGCVGDALMAAAILAEPACTHVQDAEFGVTLLSKE